MKSVLVKALVLTGLLSPLAYSLSLYDTAPPIGLPVSHALKYNANLYLGYDDNLNASRHNKQSGYYVRFGLGASYADYESVTKITYTVHAGGQLYNKSANGTNQRLFSDITANASLSHSFSAGSVLSMTAGLSFRPEPDYANGISAARTQGDCLNWNLSASYAQTIDSRWSWTITGSTSGNVYDKSAYKIDDRQYLSLSLSLHYRQNTQTSYSAACSYRHDFRSHGLDSKNVYATLGVNHSLSPISSANLTAGFQTKFIGGECNVYPNLRAGYQRKLAEGLSANSYLSLDNENVNTYNGNSNFLSDLTWRVGTDLTYAIDSLTSATFGVSLLSSNYSRGTNGMGSIKRTTWSLTCGMHRRINEQWNWNVRYNYTHSTGSLYGYDRNIISSGLVYNF